MKTKEFKCAYSHCKHGGIVDEKEAVKVSTRYYHPDCLIEKNAMTEIVDVWFRRVDSKPIYTNLRRTISDLVYKDGNDAEYLLFALNYCIDHGWTLRHPQGLRYVAKDTDAKDEWEKRKEQKTMIELKEEMKKMADSEPNDNWSLPDVPQQQKRNRTKVSNILGV